VAARTTRFCEEVVFMSDEGKGAEFLAGVIIGGLIGAAVGLLMAPQPGEETREQLREKGIELRERVVELSEEARKKAGELGEEGRTALETQTVRVKEAIEEGKKAASKKKKDLLEELEQESDKAPA
jgi:gas vesicle protein